MRLLVNMVPIMRFWSPSGATLSATVLVLCVLEWCSGLVRADDVPSAFKGEPSWLNIAMEGREMWRNAVPWDPNTQKLCTLVPGLSTGQTQLCHLYQDHMNSVSQGAKTGILECQHQFQHRLWNCTTVEHPSVFGKVLDNPVKEAAFIHAISSAGVVDAIGRACRDGQLATCGCSQAPRPAELKSDWRWGGCGDNLKYGYKFSQTFVDGKEREKRPGKENKRSKSRTLMNLHNNEAGRRSVFKNANVKCKCHGVSGSCSLITCWQQLSPFREIGDFLFRKYESASMVRFNNRGKMVLKKPRYGPMPTPEDLVYLEGSPDFCVQDEVFGSFGTKDRTCNPRSRGRDGCKHVCCSRGYTTQNVTIREKCKCKFHWCCSVECQDCWRTALLSTCN